MTHGVYVAGAVADRETIADVIERVNELPNCHVTHDWTAVMQSTPQAALADVRLGVIPADVVIAVLTNDDYRYKGTYFELGAAMTMRELQGSPQVWVVSPRGDPRAAQAAKAAPPLPHSVRSCFVAAAQDRFFTTVEEAIAALELLPA